METVAENMQAAEMNKRMVRLLLCIPLHLACRNPRTVKVKYGTSTVNYVIIISIS